MSKLVEAVTREEAERIWREWYLEKCKTLEIRPREDVLQASKMLEYINE